MTPTDRPARALWFTGKGQATLQEETVPKPQSGQVRVRAIASAISHGTEGLVYRGQIPAGTALDLPTLAGSFDYPIKYGYAMAGSIIDTGNDVDDLSAGDLIFALHPHQEIFTLDRTLVTRLPADLDPLHAVFTANLETALNIVHDTPLFFGETVAVFGLGTVGLLVSGLLARSGARDVIGIDPLPFRRELGRHLGCTMTQEPGPDLISALREVTGGRGPDVAIDASGAPTALQSAIDAVALDGTVVVASWYGTKRAELELGGNFHRGRVRIRSSQVGHLNPETSARWDFGRRTAEVIRLLSELPLGDLISHRIPFHSAPAAYELLDDPPDDLSQIVFVYE